MSDRNGRRISGGVARRRRTTPGRRRPRGCRRSRGAGGTVHLHPAAGDGVAVRGRPRDGADERHTAALRRGRGRPRRRGHGDDGLRVAVPGGEPPDAGGRHATALCQPSRRPRGAAYGRRHAGGRGAVHPGQHARLLPELRRGRAVRRPRGEPDRGDGVPRRGRRPGRDATRAVRRRRRRSVVYVAVGHAVGGGELRRRRRPHGRRRRGAVPADRRPHRGSPGRLRGPGRRHERRGRCRLAVRGGDPHRAEDQTGARAGRAGADGGRRSRVTRSTVHRCRP